MNAFPEPMEFVLVPAGEFVMGGDYGPNNHPPHLVYLDAYRIAKYQTTNARFVRFIRESGYAPEGDWRSSGECTPADYPGSYPDYPVINVSWNDAKAFCDFYGYRLPSEAEWEKAARGTDSRAYPWGNAWEVKKCNNYKGPRLKGMLDMDQGRGTLPVGSFPAGTSPYGAMDMAGNVWEWCADWYEKDYYALSPYHTPRGPESGSGRILRGGSWCGNSGLCRCIWRYIIQVEGWYIGNAGFRCAV